MRRGAESVPSDAADATDSRGSSPGFDPLKSSPSPAARRDSLIDPLGADGRRAMDEFRLLGASSNVGAVRSLGPLRHPRGEDTTGTGEPAPDTPPRVGDGDPSSCSLLVSLYGEDRRPRLVDGDASPDGDTSPDGDPRIADRTLVGVDAALRDGRRSRNMASGLSAAPRAATWRLFLFIRSDGLPADP